MSKQDLDFGGAANNDAEFCLTAFPKVEANFVRLWTESENVLYVAKQGDDTNDGFTTHEAFKTIQAAILAAETYIGTGDLISPAKIEVLDAAEYTENVTISDGLNLYAPTATLIGKVVMVGQTSCVLNRHVWTTGTMVDRTDNDNTKNAFYKANEADMTAAGIGGAFCYPTGTGDIFVEVDLILLNSASLAFTDETTGSTIYFKVKQCLGNGFGSILVRTDGDATLIWGQCDHYENTGNGYVVYQNSASEIQLFGLEWNAAVLYRNEDAAGVLRFICPNVSGTRQNNGGGTVVEWSTDTIASVVATQAEMEAGTETALRSMSPLNIAQAIAALTP